MVAALINTMIKTKKTAVARQVTITSMQLSKLKLQTQIAAPLKGLRISKNLPKYQVQS